MILPGFHLCKAQPRCFSSCVEGPRCLEPVPTGPGQWLPVICSYTWCGSENRGQKSPHRCASMSVGQVPTRRTARQSTAPPGCHSQPFPWPQAQGVLTPSHLPHSDMTGLFDRLIRQRRAAACGLARHSRHVDKEAKSHPTRFSFAIFSSLHSSTQSSPLSLRSGLPHRLNPARASKHRLPVLSAHRAINRAATLIAY